MEGRLSGERRHLSCLIARVEGWELEAMGLENGMCGEGNANVLGALHKTAGEPPARTMSSAHKNRNSSNTIMYSRESEEMQL